MDTFFSKDPQGSILKKDKKMNNILELLEKRGIFAKRVSSHKGSEYHSPCPVCGGDDRFHVWPEQNDGSGSFWCRQCGIGGDNIQFIIETEGLSFKEASEKVGRKISQQPYSMPQTTRRKKTASNARSTTDDEKVSNLNSADLWQQKAAKFLTWAQQHLLADKKQMAYLKGRGINEKSVIKYGLGYNPGNNGKDLFRPRETWGLATERKPNGQKKRLWIPSGIVIPLIINNQILRLRIRRPQGEPRYLVIPGSAMSCMISQLSARCYVVLEAELDHILVDQAAGDVTGVVALGNSSRKPDPKTHKALTAAGRILVALDFDGAGKKAGLWWDQNFKNSRRWPVPVGGDPGEAFEQGVNIRNWVIAGFPKAWQNGHSPLVDERGGGAKKAKQQTVPTEQVIKEVPEDVKRLAELMQGQPVSIHVTETRTTFRYSQNWASKHWERSQKMSKLIYFNEKVFAYLERHPKEIITAENIL